MCHFIFQVSSAVDKSLMAEEKNRIQEQLRNELGIMVDAPKQGTGNTNDGNTARTFFNNIEIISRVTGEEYIKSS